MVKMKNFLNFFLLVVIFVFLQTDARRISFKNLKVKLIKQKASAYETIGKAKLAKKVVSAAADIYFDSIMDSITQELENAGYKLLDKSFEGILEILTSLETDQNLARKLKEETDAFNQAIFIALAILVALSIIILTIFGIFMRRLHVRTTIFMINSVKRFREVKKTTAILVKKVDAIKPEEKQDLIDPMFVDLHAKKTKL